VPLLPPIPALSWFNQHRLLTMVLVCLFHLLLSWLGLQVPFFNEHISLIWPATGFTIAVIWRLGYSYSISIAVSVILLTSLQGLPLASSIALGLGNALGPALAVRLFAVKKLRYQLDNARDLIWFLVFSIGVGTFITSVNGASQLWISGYVSDALWFSTMLAWWFGDSFGVLVFGIPLLCFQRRQWRLLSGWRFWSVLSLSGLTSLLVFWIPGAHLWSPTLLFVPLLVLLWIVLRQGLWASSVNVALITSLAVIGTVQGRGMFVDPEPLQSLFSISSYILVISLFSYLLAFLHQSSERTRDNVNSALQGSGLGIWQLDLQQDQVQFFGQAEVMLGYQAGELGRGFQHWTNLLHPDDAAPTRLALTQHLKGITPLYQIEFRLRHKAGHWVWMLSQGRVVERDAQGRASRMVGSNTDISALKQADLAVSQLKDFYATVLSKVVTGVWVGDARHRLIYVNQGLSRLMSMAETDLLNKQILTDFPEQTLQHFRPFYYRAMHGLTPVRFEALPIQTPGGRQLFLSGWLVPLLKDGSFDGMIGTVDDMTQQRQYEQQILQLAFVDQLTGLPNRAALQDKARDLLAGALQQQQQLAVYHIDLDHFQHINDSMGHDTGDMLLKMVAERLKMLTTAQDLLSRPGGDEFFLIRACRTEHDVLQTAHQLILLMSEAFAVEERMLQVSCSIGIALFPQHGLSFAELQRMADIALYAAKAAGRNRYSLYNPQMSEILHERLQLEHGMRSGLYAGQFSLHYQPVQTLADRQIVSVEALLRWQHPQLGNVSPVRFIPLAEHSGFIVELGEWVLQQALKQLARWRTQGVILRVAVNISTVQLRHPDFLRQLQQALTQHGVAGNQLELELTESVLAEQVEQSRHLLQQIRALGVTLALDDFGTGYSSLAYLKSFPLDKLKIDRSFVRDLLTDPDDRAIVHSVVVLGHSLGMRVVAEGVEDAGQLHQLQQMDVDEVQGYLLSKPLPPEELENWLRRVHSLGLPHLQ
jgi:diguanylate cyclase (GGDEF)-like protein/PAS domain S-box-containing protein